MTQGSGKHARRGAAPAPPPPRTSNLPGVRVLAALVAVVLVTAVVLWLVWAPWSDEGAADPGPRSDTTAGRGPSYGADWTTSEGGTYRVSVVPSTRVSPDASADGCIPAPRGGQVNATFTLRIENLAAKAGPVPALEVGSNVGPRGVVRPATLSLQRSSRRVALTPRADGASCTAAAGLDAAGREPIPAGGTVTFRGVLGPLLPGVAARGLALIVRYHQAEPSAPGGATGQEFVVPFALGD